MENPSNRSGKRIVLAAIDEAGLLTGIGRAPRAAIVQIDKGKPEKAEEIDVKWGEAHETEQEGLHHASIAKFMRAHNISDVIAAGAGSDMQGMLSRLGISVHFGSGNYRDALEGLLKELS